MARTIKLTKGYTTLVDDDVYEWARHFRWYAHESKGKVYAVRRVGLVRISLHRMIVQAGDGALVDHRDGNGLNNQRANLRSATSAQNCQNRRRKRPGLTGVRWSTSRQSWEATLVVGGVRHRRHGFTSPQAAAAAYDELAALHHGEFAVLNRTSTPVPPRPKAKPLRRDAQTQDGITIFKRYAGPDAVFYTVFRVLGKRRTVRLGATAAASFKQARKLKREARESRFDCLDTIPSITPESRLVSRHNCQSHAATRPNPPLPGIVRAVNRLMQTAISKEELS